MIGAFSFGCDGNEGDDCGDSPCGDSQACCEGACVFTISDRNNCGGCGIVCSGGSCSNGMCIAAVDAGNTRCGMLRPCGTECVERSVPQNTDGRSSASFQNCNGCGIACDPERATSCSILGGGTTGSPSCLCGEFLQCPAGDVCINDGTLTRCTSLSTDINNCGAIGTVCATGESCTAGMCVCGSTGAACAEGESCCGGACGTGGCCGGALVDTQNDEMNCGECGNVCTPNAPNCVAGGCTCEIAGRACEEPVPGDLLGGTDPELGESCCDTGCVANSNENCACGLCGEDTECIVAGGGAIPLPPPFGSDGPPVACCGTEIPFIGGMCEGSLPLPFDAGFPPPTDGGVSPTDAGTTSSDAGTVLSDAGTDAGSSMDAGTDAGGL